ncbi:hypothetical protein SAMN05660845_2302 [Flavobacterium swingsii]|uniref:Aminopeptidase n=2 Tax=Flavobacterium swingsii TaxID=498292 RepID=A0A1I0ZM92_9FLAO|nr:hypothetical protein SAMN05660845_2302 [Flavobacterium swingsii]
MTRNYGQQQTKMTVLLDDFSRSLIIKQTIQFTNNSDKPISKLVLNDWNHAYSNKYSPLGKRFSDEYVRNFHLASDYERGSTTITKILVNDSLTDWNRAENNLDIVEIVLKNNLEPSKSITLNIEYNLRIPNSKFTRFGYDNGKYLLNNCFLSLARLSKDGQFTYYSNENLEDIANAVYTKINIDFVIPKNYEITCNLDFITQIESDVTKKISFSNENSSQIQFAIEKNNSYESFKNDNIEVQTNLYDVKISGIQKAIIIDKIVNYVSDNLGKIPAKKIIVSQVDYERNPFYGLNQLPSFLSPFPNEFLYEIKFLKAYLHNYLKSSLKIDIRKDSYIFDATQVYIMMKYIEENHPEMKLIGNLGTYKLTKSYFLSKANFNEQYNYLFLLMARKNLDQSIGNSKETLIKFNEQIAGKYKAGLIFKYLNDYLNDNSVEKSFKEFIVLNQSNQTDTNDFQEILKKNTSQNIDWFFDNLIYSNKPIDYSFSKTKKTKEHIAVTIQNNSTITVPISVSGIKNNQVIFRKWLPNITSDTTLVFPEKYLDKLILNDSSNIPEFSKKNNYKSLKGLFSLNRPIKFNLLRDLEDSRYNQIFYTPEIGYNLYDGAIISLTLDNETLLNKPFRYNLSPSYSAATRSMTGSMSYYFNQQRRDSKLYNIGYGLNSSYYHYIQNAAYLKVNSSVSLSFRDLDLRSNKRQNISFRLAYVNKESSPLNNPNSQSPLKFAAYDGSYSYQKPEMSSGFGFGTGLSFSKNFGKATTGISYRKLFENNYQIGLRLFAGIFFYNKDINSNAFGLDRPKDVLLDYNFYGRSESTGFFSQQIIIAEGGFKSKLENPYANKWMTTLNVTSSVWHWIELYGDAGFYQSRNQNVKFGYDSGLHLDLVPNYLELFLPIYSTNGFEMGQKNYQEKIRFIFTISPKTLTKLFTRKWF